MEPNLYCNSSFPIEKAPNGIPLGAKINLKSVNSIKFWFDSQNSEIYLKKILVPKVISSN